MNEKQMQDMAVSILLDEYTQLDVAQLLKEYEDEEESSELPNVPDALDKKCTKLIRREFNKKKQKKIITRISKTLSRVAVVTLMLIGLCTVSVLSVKAWREPALRFVLETFDRRSSASMEGEIFQDSKTPIEIIERLRDLIQPDYNLISKRTGEEYYQAMFVEKTGKVVKFTASVYRHDVYFDTENAEGTWIHINGNNAILTEKNGCSIRWLDEPQNMIFDLYAGNWEKEELLDLFSLLTE